MDHLQAREKDAAEFYHVTPRTIRNWVVDGCPQNPDKSYNLFHLHEWILKREIRKLENSDEGESLNEQKTLKQIELLNEQIQKQKMLNEELQKVSMLVSDHEEILAARFRGLIDFIKVNFECRFKDLANKSESETRVLGRQLMKGLLRAYCDQFTESDLGESNEESS